MVLTSTEQLVDRLHAPINKGSVLRAENVNVAQAGSDAFVEQLSTISRDGRDHVSIICHIFTVKEGRITGMRAYRNDKDLPPG